MRSDIIFGDRQNAVFHTLLASAINGIIVTDDKGRIQIYNPACEVIFGYEPDEVVGRNVKILMPGPYDAAHDDYLSDYRKTGVAHIMGIGRESVGRRKDGSDFPIYLSIGEGKIRTRRFFVGIIRDLTETKAEAGRKNAAYRLLAQIVQSSEIAILSTTLAGIITSWNSAADRMFGHSAQDAVGQHVSIIMPPSEFERRERIVAELKSGREITRHEAVGIHKDGREILLTLSFSPIYNASDIVGVSTMARDITQERTIDAKLQKLHTELAHVARLSAMGQMTAAIAHELNQPLAAITNYVSAARRTLTRVPDDEDEAVAHAREFVEKAGRQALRAGGIIRNLRDFIEKRDSDRGTENPNAVVREAAALAFVGGLNSNVAVRFELEETLPCVMIDKIQIEQVLVNLIRNSVEAMASIKKRELILTTASHETGFVQITVADTGTGLPPEVAARLFQPFTTTKEKGMGMGLTICRSIIEDHGGRIWLIAGRAQGTAFGILLPSSDSDVSQT